MWNIYIPSGKRLHNYGKSPCLMGNSNISMVIFNSYVWHNQKVHLPCLDHFPKGFNHRFSTIVRLPSGNLSLLVASSCPPLKALGLICSERRELWPGTLSCVLDVMLENQQIFIRLNPQKRGLLSGVIKHGNWIIECKWNSSISGVLIAKSSTVQMWHGPLPCLITRA